MSQLVDLVSARVHKASGLAPPSPNVGGQWALSLWALPQKRAHHAPHHNICGPREEEATLQDIPHPKGSSTAIAGPSGSSQLLAALHW